MRLKVVVLALVVWLFYFFLVEVASVANQHNLIEDEEKRGILKNDLIKPGVLKRDVLGHRQHTHPPSYGHSASGYGGTGAGYPYGPPSSPDHSFGSSSYGQSGFGHSGVGSHSTGGGGSGYHHPAEYDKKALAIKTLLIPLAGIALLGAAAALTTNPVLLQLGVVNGRRKKRDLEDYGRIYPTIAQLDK